MCKAVLNMSWNCTNVFETVRKMAWNLLKLHNMFWNYMKKCSETLWNCMKLSETIWKLFWNILQLHKTVWNLWKLFWNIRKRGETTQQQLKSPAINIEHTISCMFQRKVLSQHLQPYELEPRVSLSDRTDAQGPRDLLFKGLRSLDLLFKGLAP